MAKMINEYKNLVGNPEGWRRIGKPRRSWEDNIKVALKDMTWEDVDWINFLRTGASDKIL
jgi:hypothetical protein